VYTFLSAFVSDGIGISCKCLNSPDDFCYICACVWRNRICFKEAHINPSDKMDLPVKVCLFQIRPDSFSLDCDEKE